MTAVLKKYQVPLLIVGLVIVSTLLLSNLRKHDNLNLSEQTSLTAKEYARLNSTLELLIFRYDPREAFALLRKSMKENTHILASCHGLAHGMGHASFAKYGDFGKAMLYQDEICNSGYLHGVIESYFTTSQDIRSMMGKVCEPYTPGTFIRWQCDHGIGHGVMFATDNNLPLSLSLCKTLSRDEAKTLCVNGVFMENVMADQVTHFSRYLKLNDPVFPCRDQFDQYKGHCYGYVPTNFLKTHQGKYRDALELCEHIESSFIGACMQGVGSRAIVENIDHPKIAIILCLEAKKYSDTCLRGMIYEYINHYGSIRQAEKLCQEFPEEKKSLCKETVSQKAVLFSS